MMQALSLFGLREMAMFVILLGGSGALPLGVPPEKENPVLAHIAPDECLVYAAWAGMAAADPASPNHTERLFAEPELRAFAEAVEKSIATAIEQSGKEYGDNTPRGMLARSGPLWMRTLLSRPAAIFITRLEQKNDLLQIEGGLILQADDAAPRLEAVLTALLSEGDRRPVEVTIGARKFRRLTATEHFPVELTWGAGNGYLMIGLGAGSIEGMSARIRAQQEPAWLAKLKRESGIERRSTLSYVNVKRLIASLAPLGGEQAEQAVAALGLNQLTTLTSVTGLDDSGVVSRSVLGIEGRPRGLVALVEGGGLDAADLAHVPDDALVASAAAFDARQLFDALLAAAAEIDPAARQRIDDELALLEEINGVNLAELVSALGTRWSLHAATADGGFFGAALVVDVRDRAKLARVQERLVGRLESEEIMGEYYAFTTKFGGHDLHTLASAYRPLPVAPTWCLDDKRLIVGTNPQAVRAVLARREGEASLAQSATLAPLLAPREEPLLAVSYYDSKSLFESSYASVQMAAPTVIGQLLQMGVPLAIDETSLPTLPTARSIGRHLQPATATVRRTKAGVLSERRQTLPAANLGTTLPLGVALTLPAVKSARAAAVQSQASNNLKEQLLALHNYHDTYTRFPAAYSVDDEGKPLLSWRVHILPFISEYDLYKQFRLNEPWDSEHNKKLLAKMPKAYLAPGSKAGEGKTVYLGVGGKNGMLGKPTKQGELSPSSGISFAAVTDGTSNTIAIVEASDELAVEWTKPVEWVPSDKEPLKGLLGLRPRGFLIGFCDGSVRMLPSNVAPDDLRSLFTRDDGRAVNLPADPRGAPREEFFLEPPPP